MIRMKSPNKTSYYYNRHAAHQPLKKGITDIKDMLPIIRTGIILLIK